ncbi:MAG: hypothetical protein FWH20_00325 [Oscillospiraceae bacterium]|nr:hypothetical protein [Oscillospiraceae bacterium]
MKKEKFFSENRDKILAFGEYFLGKLSDSELLDNLAEKDLEKLARIFKLMFDKGFASEDNKEKEQNHLLEEILEIFKKEGDKFIE